MRIVFASKKKLLVEAISALLADCSEVYIQEPIESLHNIQETIKPTDVIILTEPGYDCSTVCALQKLHAASQDASIILITCKHEMQSPAILFQHSVKSILTKDCEVNDLHNAIKHAGLGRPYLTQKIAQALAADFYLQREKIILSPRETEILELIAKGSQNCDIAKTLSLSSKTISAHKSNIKNRLKLRSTSQIIQYAVENELAASKEFS